MKIIQPYIEILDEINEKEILQKLEVVGRICYESEWAIIDNSCYDFIKKILKLEHLSILEHVSVSVRIICNRAISHQLVRHRIASFCQSSQRYCNYSNDKFGNELTFIKPDFNLTETDKQVLCWIEDHYMKRLNEGLTAQQARYFLPNGLKTKLIATMNLRQWRYVLNLRTSKKADPQMQQIMNMILDKFIILLPTIFSDIKKE